MSQIEQREGFAPCPTCRQYSHSLGDDALADAFNHFQSMYAHPVRGHPMGHHFDQKTRDAAQVLMAAARTPSPSGAREIEERARQLLAAAAYRDGCREATRDEILAGIECYDQSTRIKVSAALLAVESALRSQGRGDDLTVSEKLKLDIGAAIMEERNPGLDDYAGAFNQGISEARRAAFKIIDLATISEGM